MQKSPLRRSVLFLLFSIAIATVAYWLGDEAGITREIAAGDWKKEMKGAEPGASVKTGNGLQGFDQCLRRFVVS